MSLEPIILAELQRGGPPLWVSGRTYPKGWEVRSPANLQRYVRKASGAGATDPSEDTDNWELWSKTVDTKLDALSQSVTSITAKLAAQPRKVIVYCPMSRAVKAPFTGWVRARIMGSAGSGAAGGGVRAHPLETRELLHTSGSRSQRETRSLSPLGPVA